MEVDKLNTGEKVAAISAVLLFIFMFFTWFGVEVSTPAGTISGSGPGGSAWDALEYIPIVLVIAIVTAIGAAVLRLTDSAYEPPISMNAVVTVLGGLSTLLILFRIVDPPSFGGFGFSVSGTVEIGIFLGLIAAAGIAVGGYLGMKEEGTSFSDTADRLSGGGGPPAGPPPPPSSPPPPPPPAAQQPPPPPSSPPPPPPPPTGGSPGGV